MEAESIIVEIYDSIGTCGDCEYFREFDYNEMARCKFLEINTSKSWYCADFERKTDDSS